MDRLVFPLSKQTMTRKKSNIETYRKWVEKMNEMAKMNEQKWTTTFVRRILFVKCHTVSAVHFYLQFSKVNKKKAIDVTTDRHE